MKTPLLHSLRSAFRLAQMAQSQPDKTLDDLLVEQEKYATSRRKFLKTSAQAGLILSMGGGTAAFDWLGAGGKPPASVAIVGGGMSGLSAAYYLRRKGVKATVFEGDKRAGGRIKSGLMFGSGSLTTEIGAEFIDTVHSDMLWFTRALGFQDKLIDVEQDKFGIRDAFFLENQHHNLRDVVAELGAAYPRILADQKNMERRQAAAFDRISMGEYIDGLPVSGWVKKMLHVAYIGENGLETGEQSAANLLDIFEIRNENFYPFGSSDERFKVIGGNEQIPQGLAKMLAEQMRYEHRLVSLRENSNRSLTLVFSENGTTREATFDLVILTLPFTVLREVDVQMELPLLKQQVIKELGYGTNSKFIVETRERTWRQRGYRGFLFNEQIHNGWDASQMQQGNEGVGAFTCFLGGERGRTATRGTEQELSAQLMPQLEGAFPGSQTSLTGKTELAHWPGNPFVRGSYSCFRPGQVGRFEGAAAAPVRRLYFAGEHCSSEYWGFMNGAAETGRKVAEQVLKRMRVR